MKSTVLLFIYVSQHVLVVPLTFDYSSQSIFFHFLGRCFDGHILDMIELGIDKFISLNEIKVRQESILS